MSFLHRAGHTLKDKMSSSDNPMELTRQSVLHCIEQNQFRWFGHLIRVHPEKVFQISSSWEEIRGKPKADLRDYISHFVWEHLRIPQGEMENVATKKDV